MRILDSLFYVLQLWYRLKHSVRKCYPSFVVHYAVRADGRQHLISGPSRVKGDETLMGTKTAKSEWRSPTPAAPRLCTALWG
jgi:hypothetical protein